MDQEIPCSQPNMECIPVLKELKKDLEISVKLLFSPAPTTDHIELRQTISNLLHQLSNMNVTVGDLRITKIGKLMTKLQNQLPEDLAEQAKLLNDKWKGTLHQYRQELKKSLKNNQFRIQSSNGGCSSENDPQDYAKFSSIPQMKGSAIITGQKTAGNVSKDFQVPVPPGTSSTQTYSRENLNPTITSANEFYTGTFLQNPEIITTTTTASSENKNMPLTSPNLHQSGLGDGAIENPTLKSQRPVSLERQISVSESQQKLFEFTQSFSKMLDKNVSSVISLQKECVHMLESMQDMKDKLASFEDEMKTKLASMPPRSPDFQSEASALSQELRIQHNYVPSVSSNRVLEPSGQLFNQQNYVSSISKISTNCILKPILGFVREIDNSDVSGITDSQSKLGNKNSRETLNTDLTNKSTTMPRKSLMNSVLNSMSLPPKRKTQSPDESPTPKKTFPPTTNHNPERSSSDERGSSSGTEDEAYPKQGDKIQVVAPQTSSAIHRIKQEPADCNMLRSSLEGEQHLILEVDRTSSVQPTSSCANSPSIEQQRVTNLCANNQSTTDEDSSSGNDLNQTTPIFSKPMHLSPTLFSSPSTSSTNRRNGFGTSSATVATTIPLKQPDIDQDGFHIPSVKVNAETGIKTIHFVKKDNVDNKNSDEITSYFNGSSSDEEFLSYSQQVVEMSDEIEESDKDYLLDESNLKRSKWNKYCKRAQQINVAVRRKSHGRLVAAHARQVGKEAVQKMLDKKKQDEVIQKMCDDIEWDEV